MYISCSATKSMTMLRNLKFRKNSFHLHNHYCRYLNPCQINMKGDLFIVNIYSENGKDDLSQMKYRKSLVYNYVIDVKTSIVCNYEDHKLKSFSNH